VAVPIALWPDDEKSTAVKNTIKSLGEFVFSSNKTNEEAITLGPYRFLENNAVYMG